MTPSPRDQVDEAIDSVAARMTSVIDDPTLAHRIVESLPPQSTFIAVLLGSWTLRFAALAVLAVGLTVARRNVPTIVHTGVPTSVQATVQASVPTNVQTDVQVPNDRLNDRMNVRPNVRLNASMNDRLNAPDHERSLPSIGAVDALSVGSIANERLPEDAPLTLKPLEIADLPLTADSFSPR